LEEDLKREIQGLRKELKAARALKAPRAGKAAPAKATSAPKGKLKAKPAS